MFDYTKIHIFDKKGTELPISITPNMVISVKNMHNDDAKFVPISTPEGTIGGYHKLCSGSRYTIDDLTYGDSFNGAYSADFAIGNDASSGGTTATKVIMEMNGQTYTADASVDVRKYASSMSDNEYYIDSIKNIDIDGFNLPFPSALIETSMSFDRVSTELVETQSLYFLAEYTDLNGNTTYMPLSEYKYQDGECKEWTDRYKMMLFIDCRKQKDFRFFTIDNDEVIWSDRQMVNFNASDDSAFRVNVGFTGEHEGVYAEPMYICLIDTHMDAVDENDTLYTIGSIGMTAETVGEDERYRALFANFGVPHPSTFIDTYKDYDSDEGKIDNAFLNEKSKELFLSYSEIFPYAGSYKALINAIKVLGYDDIFFKEWYKELGMVDDSGYVAFDMAYKSDKNANTISNRPLRERIHLKKLNWVSMMYHLNVETDEVSDKLGFPTTVKESFYSTSDSILKLISLKKWLEKYVTGLNCRIVDIGGEGLYFERYRHDAVGSYQQVISYDSIKNLSPYVEESANYILDSNSACDVSVNIGCDDTFLTLEDFQHTTFESFCEGVIDSVEKIYTQYDPNNTYREDDMMVGPTIYSVHNFQDFCIKATSAPESFKFGKVMDESIFVEKGYPALIFDNGNLRIDDTDLMEYERNVPFSKKGLPTIMIEEATIYDSDHEWVYKIHKNTGTSTSANYIVEYNSNGRITTAAESDDYINIKPPYMSSTQTVREYDVDMLVTNIVSIRGGVNITRNEYELRTVDFDTQNYEKFIPRINTRTNGLRFAYNKNIHADGFYICGYSISTYKKILPLNNEYFIDIHNGSMIFDDAARLRTIYLNFKYNESTHKVDTNVEISYYNENIAPITYRTAVGGKFNAFELKKGYLDFYNEYTYNTDSAIILNNMYPFRVYNAGKINFEVVGRDAQNNVFSVRCKNCANVRTDEPELHVISNTSRSNNEYNIPGDRYTTSALNPEYIDKYDQYCILGPSYKQSKISIQKDASGFINIDSSINVLYSDLPKSGDIMSITDATDEFEIVGIQKIEDNLAVSGIERFELVLNKTDHKDIKYNMCAFGDYDTEHYDRNKIIEKLFGSVVYRTATDVLNRAADMPASKEDYFGIPTYFEVNAIFYNKLGDYPIMQIPGYFCSDKFAYSGADKMYKLVILDDIRKYYIWHKYTGEPTPGVLHYSTSDSSYAAVTTQVNGEYYYVLNKIYSDEMVYANYPRMIGDESIYSDVSVGAIINDINTVVYIIPTWKNKIKKSSIVYSPVSDETGMSCENLIRNRFKENDLAKVSVVSYKANLSQASYIVKRCESDKIILKGKLGDASNNNIDMYISYPTEAYVNYSFALKDTSVSESSILYGVEDTNYTKRLFNYIDSNQNVSYRNFDMRNAHRMWMPNKYSSATKIYTPKIADSACYRYDIPITVTQSNACVMCCPEIGEYSSVRWDVYYRQAGLKTRTLLFTSYNKNLSIEPSDVGIYDFVLTVYDVFGNKHTRSFDGLITTK